MQYELLAHTIQKMGAGLYCLVLGCPYNKTPFSQLHSLTAHLRRHTGERGRFSCTLCHKTFARRSQMQQHVDSHNVSAAKVGTFEHSPCVTYMLFRAVIFFLSRFKFKRQAVHKIKPILRRQSVLGRRLLRAWLFKADKVVGVSELRVDMGLRSCRSGCDFVAIFRLNLKAKFLQLALVKY